MKPDDTKHVLRSINALIDKSGKIRGYFAPSTPIKGLVCRWPQFPVLSPPMSPRAKVKKTVH